MRRTKPNLIIRTEVWETGEGVVTKAVVRDLKGHFVGATNQTAAVRHPKSVVKNVLVGKNS
jgi:hypothetical protein